MRSLPRADSAFFIFAKTSELVANKENRGRAENADDDHDRVVADKIGINHQRDAEEHRFPEVHSLAVNESDETDRAEDESANQVDCAEVQHVDLPQLDLRHPRT